MPPKGKAAGAGRGQTKKGGQTKKCNTGVKDKFFESS
jgi:hypothetical protein